MIVDNRQVRRAVVGAICLTVLASPAERWLDVIAQAALTYTQLKDAGLIELLGS